MKNKLNEVPPRVAIIGRPNVGKSTLFNILTDSRKSVVKNQPGVTRDLIFESVEIWGKKFDLIDTGGITESKDVVSQLIKEHVSQFLGTVDLALFVVDGRAGLVPEDRDIFRLLHESEVPFIVVVNKLDSHVNEELNTSEFYEFGGELISCSFEQRRGISEILEWLHTHLPESSLETEKGLQIAMVGKPNVGKSSLCNHLLGENRMLVSEIAGTTVDSVDSPFTYNGKNYVLVDTAGLRRSSRREDDIEIISAFKSQEAIRRSELILLVVDACIGPTEQDAKILNAILEEHRAVILVANKTDIASKEIPEFRKTFRRQVEDNFHFFTDIPIVYVSAKTGFGISDLFNEINRIHDLIHTRISTRELNDFFFETIRKAPSPVFGNSNVKFYYLTQTKQIPPAFIAFANHPEGVTTAYRRFLIKNIKESWGLHGLPIRIFCMKTRKGNSSHETASGDE